MNAPRCYVTPTLLVFLNSKYRDASQFVLRPTLDVSTFVSKRSEQTNDCCEHRCYEREISHTFVVMLLRFYLLQRAALGNHPNWQKGFASFCALRACPVPGWRSDRCRLLGYCSSESRSLHRSGRPSRCGIFLLEFTRMARRMLTSLFKDTEAWLVQRWTECNVRPLLNNYVISCLFNDLIHRLVYLRNEILKCQTSICCTVQLILYYLDVKPVHMHLFVNYLVAKLIYIYLFLLFMC